MGRTTHRNDMRKSEPVTVIHNGKEYRRVLDSRIWGCTFVKIGGQFHTVRRLDNGKYQTKSKETTR